MKQLSNIKKEQGNLGRISMEKIKKKIDIKINKLLNEYNTIDDDEDDE